MRNYFLKRWFWVIPGILAFLLTQYARLHPAWTETVYSLTIYPVLANVVGFLPSLVSFSVTEWLMLLFIVACLIAIIFSVRKFIVTKKERKMLVYRGIVSVLAIVSMIYFLFTLLCGLNYYRYTFTDYTGYDIGHSSQGELGQLCANLADELVEIREELPTDIYTSTEFATYSEKSVDAMQELADDYPVLERSFYSHPKPVLLSKIMSSAGITGVFFPFTMESNVNRDVPFYTIPATMTHELAHQVGFMREDEANFIAYLACKEVKDPLMKYSGLSLAFSYAISALNRVSPEKANAVKSRLSPQVQQDRAYNSDYFRRYRGKFYDFSTNVNNTYLKANNQKDGVASYGRMVELLLAEQQHQRNSE
ncbi:DUF3810 domain-containing protein [Enterococcus sp. 669A]|uniref:DUF3810 domain-containing protein n=1 Tax=Candidatus Enterococcus moelleringii TaxID=2815325 RepID=A0ABS3L8V2_9ENTE|nr:DUF3810 domain-containing protein [Enterococcus sp. 669A]MBO1306051.1 DUF3810 domain-containing protein [Enterococcus sp. 669A]